MHLAQLRDYVDLERRGHYIEGYAGEYIMPNWAVYERESRLCVDVEAYQDGSLGWNAPRAPYRGDFPFHSSTPPALRAAEAMQQLGLFIAKGAASDVGDMGQLGIPGQREPSRRREIDGATADAGTCRGVDLGHGAGCACD